MKLPDQIVRDFVGAQRNFEAIQGLFPLASALLADGSVTPMKLATLPQCLCRNTGNVAIANNTVTNLPFDGEHYDLGTTTPQHDNAVNNTLIFCRQAGLYQATLRLAWPAAAGTLRFADIITSTGAVIAADRRKAQPGGANLDDMTLTSVPWRFAVGEQIATQVFQDSGGTVTFTVDQLTFGWVWLSP